MTTEGDFYIEIENLLVRDGGIKLALTAMRDRYPIGDGRRDTAITLLGKWNELSVQQASHLVTEEEATVAKSKIMHSILQRLRSGDDVEDDEECVVDPIPLIDRVEIVSDYQAFLEESIENQPQIPVIVVAVGHYLQGHTHLAKRLVNLNDGLKEQKFTVQPDVRRVVPNYGEADCSTLFPECLCQSLEVRNLETLVTRLNGAYQEPTLHVFEMEIYSQDRAEWKDMFPDIQAALESMKGLALAPPVSVMLLISIKLNGGKDDSWFRFLSRDTDAEAREILDGWRNNSDFSHCLRVLPELGHIERRHINDWKYNRSTQKYLERLGIDLDQFDDKSFDFILSPDLTLLDFKDKFEEWVRAEKANAINI